MLGRNLCCSDHRLSSQATFVAPIEDGEEFGFGLDECVNDIRVKVRADFLKNDRLGNVVAEGILVNALARQRVVYVSQSDDAPAQGDFSPCKFRRVTRPVESLVMRGDNVSRHFQELDAGELTYCRVERLSADGRVLLHDLKFPVAEPTRFKQYTVGDAYLADVVQRTGEIDQPDIFPVDAVAELFHAR